MSTEEKLFKVSIVEFDEDWFPFHFRFDLMEEFYEVNIDMDDEDEEGISDM